MKQAVSTTHAPKPGAGPYSQAIIANGFIFTQGSIALTPEGTLVEGTVEDQMRQIMSNLSEILKAAGATFDDVVKTTIYVTDMSVYGEVNTLYAGYLKEPYPARETVCVKELPLKAQIEISMIALIS